MDNMEFNRLMHDYLRSINGKLAQIMHKVFMPLNLSPQQCMVLRKLRSEARPLTVSELAVSMHSPLSNATNMCNRLTEGGYVEKLRDGADQRKVYLRLTDEGRKIAVDVEEAAHALIENMISQVTDSDRQTIIFGLQKLDELISNELKEED